MASTCPRWRASARRDAPIGEDIPLSGRIVAVADEFDCMIRRRPYRAEVLAAEDAISELQRQSGSQFDPFLVLLFVELHNNGQIVAVLHRGLAGPLAIACSAAAVVTVVYLTTAAGRADSDSLDQNTGMNMVAVIAQPGRTSEMVFDAIAAASRDADVPDQ